MTHFDKTSFKLMVNSVFVKIMDSAPQLVMGKGHNILNSQRGYLHIYICLYIYIQYITSNAHIKIN